MKKILIIGSAGFVGSNLIPSLITKNLFDFFVFIDKEPFSIKQINQLETAKIKYETYISSKLFDNLNLQDIDSVVCLAGSTSVDAALGEPKKAIDENISIASKLAEWARCENPTAKIIYMSSDEVLGESLVALSEDSPLNPTQPYAVSKASAEMILHNYRDIYNLNIITLRSCNLIGTGQKKPKLIPTAIDSLVNNKPIPIHGNGNQLREWMAVEDLCQAIVLLLQMEISPQIFQATSGIKLSVNEIVQIVADKLGLRLVTIHVPDRLVQDTSYSMKANRLISLGWQPITTPLDAISRTVSIITEDMKDKLDILYK